MNILVTGANGQLGNEIRLLAKDSNDKYVFTDVVDASNESVAMLKKIAGTDINTVTEHLDITKLDDIREVVKHEKIDVIVNCAAYTNVDAAEDHYTLADLLNSQAVENLALVMHEINGLLVHISTDYVFGGDPYNIPCKEDQKGTPTGVYGVTKLHGEEAVQRVGCKHVIIRTAWLYSEFGKNFVKTMLNRTATKPQLKVVFDQVGTPTYAYDLAQAIVVAIEDYKKSLTTNPSSLTYAKSGVYHYSNEGVCSWFDFTKMIQQIGLEIGYYNRLPKQGDLEGLCDIQPCHSDEFPSPVKRPAFSVLDKTKVKETFGIKVPYWTDPLRKCMNNLLK